MYFHITPSFPRIGSGSTATVARIKWLVNSLAWSLNIHCLCVGYVTYPCFSSMQVCGKAVKFPAHLWFVTHPTLLRLSVTHGVSFHLVSWVHSPWQLYQSVGEMLTEPTVFWQHEYSIVFHGNMQRCVPACLLLLVSGVWREAEDIFWSTRVL